MKFSTFSLISPNRRSNASLHIDTSMYKYIYICTFRTMYWKILLSTAINVGTDEPAHNSK